MSTTEFRDRNVVVIRPRDGVSASEVVYWLETNFQVPGRLDAGPTSENVMRVVGGNPLVNARFVETRLGETEPTDEGSP